MTAKNGAKAYTENPVIKVNIDHIDTMDKYTAYTDGIAAAATSRQWVKLYELLAGVISEWNLPGDPKNPEDYGKLHPRDFAEAQKVVNKAVNGFFQD